MRLMRGTCHPSPAVVQSHVCPTSLLGQVSPNQTHKLSKLSRLSKASRALARQPVWLPMAPLPIPPPTGEHGQVDIWELMFFHRLASPGPSISRKATDEPAQLVKTLHASGWHVALQSGSGLLAFSSMATQAMTFRYAEPHSVHREV
mmetsp:Transcript_75757/g.122316  ORF Transcript_75757/g.122316 Transcript_75757/m.122316 type:complete len:147 (-) Transcript_75757:308-748(-)